MVNKNGLCDTFSTFNALNNRACVGISATENRARFPFALILSTHIMALCFSSLIFPYHLAAVDTIVKGKHNRHIIFDSPKVVSCVLALYYNEAIYVLT